MYYKCFSTVVVLTSALVSNLLFLPFMFSACLLLGVARFGVLVLLVIVRFSLESSGLGSGFH